MNSADASPDRRKNLHDEFAQLTDADRASLVAYHLGDIRDGCERILSCIDQLSKTATAELDRQSVRKILLAILSEFDDHLLPNHVKPVRPLLKALIKEWYDGRDD